KKNLVDQLPRAIASGEEKGILRMAAALSFLGTNEISKAEEVLSEIPNLVDCHAQYLSLVLKLHTATQRRDLATINSLREQIARAPVIDVRLAKAIAALGEGDFPLALAYEADALLQLAA
ncbi:MAG: hypothetical protein NTW86_11300, partial [Candidatus Sumerlaeota bacterium]|nr:hypothetical protein [Candidatus Sumerlaeota bacterium]